MRVIRGLHNLPPAPRGTAVSLGNFDGVHRGHQALVRCLQAAAGDELAVSLICFEPQPLEWLRPDKAPRRLQSLAEKLRCLRELGVEQVLVLRFGPALARMAAEDFVQRVLVDGLGARHILAGEDCRFGHRRRGDLGLLRAMAPAGGYRVEALPAVADGEQRISSTRIREALAAGELAAANAWLGRDYRLHGRVVHGQKLGRELGAATANVALRRPSPLRHGVYCVCLDGAPAVANIGLRPTVGGEREHLEVHRLEGTPDLYGRRVEVRFQRFVRPERKFADLGRLKAAIEQDIAQAKQWFAREER